MNCLNCKKPVEQTPKKRARQFCDSTCRSNYWQKEKRKEANDRTNPLTNAARGRDASGVNEDELKGEIKYKKTTKKSFDGKKHTPANDESPQIKEPKPGKTMPAGLSKSDTLRWLRENG